jgi:hypothetical protein
MLRYWGRSVFGLLEFIVVDSLKKDDENFQTE